MGLLKRLFGGRDDGGGGRFGLEELAARVGMSAGELEGTPIEYHEFAMPKRGGGTRRIDAPSAELKRVQRLLLRRVFGALRAHPSCIGFERGHSIVSHAAYHARRAVVVRVDIRDFFGTTSEKRVRAYFRRIGWDKRAADVLTGLCTFRGGLPQGAPTSPRLSNLVNYGLDVRLAMVAEREGARYSRYADDITFSFEVDRKVRIASVLQFTHGSLRDFGYRMHKKKLRVRRRGYQQQRVTGLVVNERVDLPRDVRRRLRAIEHRLATGQRATLTEEQMRGWRSLRAMIDAQAGSLDGDFTG